MEARIRGDAHMRLQFFCSPYHVNSALYPVFSHFEYAAGLSHRDPPATRLEKLASLLGVAQSSEDFQFIAAGMSLSAEPVRGTELSPQRQKAMLLGALTRSLERLANRIALLIVVEDAHWIDATSGELLSLLVDQVPSLRVLLLITMRPGLAGVWTCQRETTTITVSRLDNAASSELLRRISGNSFLPKEVEQEILGRTDGNPLFIEEITKAILEVGPTGKQQDVPEPGAEWRVEVPESLNASLLERLDRQLPAKLVAQIAAVIGRDFPYDLLSRVSDLPEQVLNHGLELLTSSGLAYQRVQPPEGQVSF